MFHFSSKSTLYIYIMADTRTNEPTVTTITNGTTITFSTKGPNYSTTCGKPLWSSENFQFELNRSYRSWDIPFLQYCTPYRHICTYMYIYMYIYTKYIHICTVYIHICKIYSIMFLYFKVISRYLTYITYMYRHIPIGSNIKPR